MVSVPNHPAKALLQAFQFVLGLYIQRSVSQSELYSPLGSGLPEYEYRKTAHTLDGIYT